MVAKMRSMKTLKELLKLNLKKIEVMAPNPFRLTRMDVVVSLQDPEYCKVNRTTIKENKRLYYKKDRAVLERLSKALKLHHSLEKAHIKENQGKRTLNKRKAASSPSTGSTLASTSPSTGSTLASTSTTRSTLGSTSPSTGSILASTSTTKTDIPELPKIFKAIIASLKEFDVTFVMERKLTKTDLEPNNSWLAMSEKQINEECKFLEHKDVAIMRILEVRDGKGRLIGMKVGLIEPSDEVFHDQVLKKWNMTSASTYNLASSSWCDLARRNHLKTNHLLNIWCFNDATNKFYFLLHHVRSEPFEPCNEINT
ncbi:hypothetical protein Ahy_B09g096247 [Arachis hypogaea]|uniref:B3 domain-containing protein n=1 Tax=Arachis hypogaea TaxID=3818 RepID=A0A444XJD2_ARAHY|nr:hypothetical protein Ahy_B09g096247 [Arachis hypogaea]